VLEAVVAAREPLTTAQLAQAAGLDPEYRLPEVLETLASFLCETEGRYTLFHQSLGDWLVAADCPYRASPAIGQRRLAELCWSEYRQGVHRFSGYSRRHLVAHLRADQRWDDLAIVLTDLAYLETRSEADDRVFGLVRDLAEAVDAWPTEHPQRSLVQLLEEALRQDANFIARHPCALFQCLWNNGWWHNNPAAEAHYHPGSRTSRRNAARLYELLERWWREKAMRTPAFCWLRRLRPPPVPVGAAQRAVLAGHVGAVRSLATSPDGRRVASSSDDASVRIWDLASGEELLCLRGHTGPVHCVTFSADGQAVVSAGTDGTVRIWDIETGAQRQCLDEHTGWVASVAASPDGRWIVSGLDDATVRVWATDTGQQRLCLHHPSRVAVVACSPDGRLVASGAEDHTVRLWDIESGSERGHLAGHKGPIRSLSFATSGSMLASGADDGTLRVWNMPAGDVRLTMEHGGPVNGVVFEADARALLSTGENDTVGRWDVRTGQRRGFLSLRSKMPMQTLALSPDGRWLLSGSDDGLVRMWDVEQVVKSNIHMDMWDMETMATREIRVAAETEAAGEPRAVVRELRGHTHQVRTLVYSPDGHWLASGGDDRNVWIWDADTGAPLRCLTGHQETIRSLAFSCDSRWLASGSEDATVRVWNVSSGQQRLTLTGHSAKVVSVAFSPDARRIISNGYREQRVWDAESGACLQVGVRSSAGIGTTAPGTIQRTTQAKDPHDSFIGYTSSVREEGRWRVTVKGQDMVLEAVGESGPVAWFPGRAERMAAHPHRDDWAGSAGWFVTIVRLEHN
jgi:WD40 repeat protein